MTEEQARDIIRQLASAESKQELQKLIGEYISVCDDVFFRVLSDKVQHMRAQGDEDDARKLQEMGDVMARLRAIKPDILIEFRQAYVGPAMRRYGNMFRAVDCPNSIGDNRVRTLDVRLLCGETAVHADPITWHDDEPPHSAAMQIIHALFSVPQISRKVAELTPPHERMLRQQMAFCREHRDVLLEGELRPLFPHQLFPLVVAKNDSKLLAAFYSGLPLRLDEEIPEQLILVNGSYTPELLLDLAAPLGTVQVTVTSCTGETLAEDALQLDAGLHRIPVPPAAHAVIRRAEG
jgi:alpha-galactosidase